MLKVLYLDLPSVFNRIEPHTVVTVGHGVGFHPLVGVIPTLGSDSFHSGRDSQVNLQPLMSVAVLSDPASSGGAMIPRLKPGAPRTVVVVVHGGSCDHSLCDATILHSQRNIASICLKYHNTLY